MISAQGQRCSAAVPEDKAISAIPKIADQLVPRGAITRLCESSTKPPRGYVAEAGMGSYPTGGDMSNTVMRYATPSGVLYTSSCSTYATIRSVLAIKAHFTEATVTSERGGMVTT
mmetsp:Transcript_10247/g.18720  ORF Transcript_10247/g.18720 Transcript_10247/m.18720 type:complete len:115 (-) Transcript_10247:821-1165(-)